MNKKKLIIIFLIFDLIVISVYFFVIKDSGTINKSETDFSVEDTSSIYKILIIENTDTLCLERKEKWVVNSSFKAKSETMNTLLKTLKLIELKSPVPENAQDFVKENLIKSKKIEIYSDNKNYPALYIGEQTSDKSGNYVMKANSEKAYIAYIPALNINLANSFSVNENEWKSNIIFSLKADEISEIKLIYSDEKENSFKIKKLESETTLTDFLEKKVNKYDTEKMSRYLTYFSDIKFEKIDNSISSTEIEAKNPFLEIYLKDINNTTYSFKAFYIYKDEIKDTNIFLGYLNNKDFVVVKFFELDLIIKSIDFFQ